MNQIVKDRVSDQVHRYLREKIIHGEFDEGKRLIEVDIAAELGVSRTPVREALWQLRSMNLIRQVGTGYEVTNVKRELLEILDVRAALESYAVRRASRVITKDQLTLLSEICDEMEQLPFSATEQRARCNRRFHEELIRAAGNERLVNLVRDYQDYFTVVQPLFDEKFIARTQREHRAIVAALRQGDDERAAACVTQHVLGAAKFLESNAAQDLRNQQKKREVGDAK
jgi:DNA-binding GntR family transcriptional regulator